MSPITGVLTKRFTVDEYYRMAEVGILAENDRVELIEGEIVCMPPIGEWHAARVNGLNQLLVVKLLGQAIVAPQNPIRLDDRSEPAPDFVLLRRDYALLQSGHPGPADCLLVIEVADTSQTFDRGQKASLYAQAGIREYWVIARGRNGVDVHREPSEHGYRNVRLANRGEAVSPLAFPDVRFTIDEILDAR